MSSRSANFLSVVFKATEASAKYEDATFNASRALVAPRVRFDFKCATSRVST